MSTDHIVEEAKRRNRWILSTMGQVLRFPDGTEFLGCRDDDAGWRWWVGPEPILTEGDVIEVPVRDGTCFRRVEAVRPIRSRMLLQQVVEFCSVGAA